MDNILQLLRLHNMFAPTDPMIGNDLPSQGGITGTMDFGNEDEPLNMMDLYHPQTAMQDRMSQMLGEFPERETPGTLKKIFASLAGAAHGPEAADRFMYAPYYERLEDWKTQFGPIAQAANQERYYNQNLRQIASNMVNQDRLERSLRRQQERDAVIARQGDRRLEQTDVRLDQGQQRIDISKELALGGKFTTEESTGKTFIVRRDGSIIPVDINNLSAYDKNALALERARASASSRPQRDRLALKPVQQPDGNVTYEVVNLDEEYSKQAAGTPLPPKQVPKSELEQGRGITNTAKQVAQIDGGRYKSYIQFDSQGRFKGIKPWSSWMPNRPSKEEYAEIYRAIYGEEPPDTPETPRPSAAKPTYKAGTGNTPPMRKEIPGHPGVFAISKDGGKTWKVE